MLICHGCLRRAGEKDPPPGIWVGKCGICHKTGNLVERAEITLEPVNEELSHTILSPVPEQVCTSCGDPCSSACPACGAYVHPYYGFMNKYCGLSHETACAGGRR